MTEESKPLSRSEREAQIKDRAGLVIVFMALFLAANTYIANNFSGIFCGCGKQHAEFIAAQSCHGINFPYLMPDG